MAELVDLSNILLHTNFLKKCHKSCIERYVMGPTTCIASYVKSRCSDLFMWYFLLHTVVPHQNSPDSKFSVKSLL